MSRLYARRPCSARQTLARFALSLSTGLTPLSGYAQSIYDETTSTASQSYGSSFAGSYGNSYDDAYSSYGDNDDVYGYDVIVNDLNRQIQRPMLRARNQTNRQTDALNSIIFHGGIGMTSLMQNMTLDDGQQIFLGQKGIQAAFGIDLLSKTWLAEGTARTFNESQDGLVRSSLQEFELKLIYRLPLSRSLTSRWGGGLSARYLNLTRGNQSLTITTPSSLATLGLDAFFTEKISIGVDLSGRTALVSETPDKNSLDATLRLDFHL